MTTMVVDEPTEQEVMDEIVPEILNGPKYKTMLSVKITEARSRNMFTGTQVVDILLDLWNALNEDTNFEEAVQEENLLPAEPVPTP